MNPSGAFAFLRLLETGMLVIDVGFIALNYLSLPAQVPIRTGFDGTVQARGTKAWLWLIPLVAAIAFAIFWPLGVTPDASPAALVLAGLLPLFIQGLCAILAIAMVQAARRNAEKIRVSLIYIWCAASIVAALATIVIH
jgi:hypothetical protein